MSVLISWSGQNARELAMLLFDLLQRVLPASEPQMLTEDLAILDPDWRQSQIPLIDVARALSCA